tara:strand:+ start:23 stop:367 length:345 start_codon:yes stop_codon:yes gene_type:complete
MWYNIKRGLQCESGRFTMENIPYYTCDKCGRWFQEGPEEVKIEYICKSCKDRIKTESRRTAMNNKSPYCKGKVNVVFRFCKKCNKWTVAEEKKVMVNTCVSCTNRIKEGDMRFK